MIERRKESNQRAEKLSPRARAVARQFAHVKPIRSIDELALGTPKDADELLEAIRELREEDLKASRGRRKRRR